MLIIHPLRMIWLVMRVTLVQPILFDDILNNTKIILLEIISNDHGKFRNSRRLVQSSWEFFITAVEVITCTVHENQSMVFTSPMDFYDHRRRIILVRLNRTVLLSLILVN